MPDVATTASGSSTKKMAQLQKERDKWEAECARARRIKIRSRATLIVCPLSTVVNWEDQFREHWAGEVLIVGGAGSNCNSHYAAMLQGSVMTPGAGASSKSQYTDEVEETEPCVDKDGIAIVSTRTDSPLKVYIYHGNARRPDPKFLADFDAVITTYATLASEYSRQTKSLLSQDADDDDDEVTIESMDMQVDEGGNQVIKIPEAKDKKSLKRRKNPASTAAEVSSALQSIHWFRVVLDEAQ